MEIQLNLFSTPSILEPKESIAKMQAKRSEFMQRHGEAVYLFRTGDFYVAVDDDAEELNRLFDITVTRYPFGQGKEAMFPHPALDTYLPKLVRAGHRVCICEFAL